MSIATHAAPSADPEVAGTGHSGLVREVLGSPKLLSVAVLVVLVVLWDLTGRSGALDPRFIGSPGGTIAAGLDMWRNGTLAENGLITLVSFLGGLALAIVIGTPVGLFMGWSLIVRRLTEPLMTVLYVTPYLALMPLIMLWVGIGTRLSMTVAVFAAIVPIIINVMAGVRGVEAIVVRVARSFGAEGFSLFRKAIFPAALPSVLTGIRLGIGRAVLGVIVAEMYVSTGGIGELMTFYGTQYRTDYVLFLFFLVGTVGYLISTAGRRVEVIVERSRGL